jgi:hypothetical protein
MELKVINTWFCESLIGAVFVEFNGMLIIFVGYLCKDTKKIEIKKGIFYRKNRFFQKFYG